MTEIISNLVDWGIHGTFWSFCGLAMLFWLFISLVETVLKYIFLLVGMLFVKKNTKMAEAIAKVYAGTILTAFSQQWLEENGQQNEAEEQTSENS